MLPRPLAATVPQDPGDPAADDVGYPVHGDLRAGDADETAGGAAATQAAIYPRHDRIRLRARRQPRLTAAGTLRLPGRVDDGDTARRVLQDRLANRPEQLNTAVSAAFLSAASLNAKPTAALSSRRVIDAYDNLPPGQRPSP